MTARERLIVALDCPSEREALAMVERLAGVVSFYKVGLQLYLSAGSSVVRALKARGHKVFLDLKLHDIPNTVAGAVAAVGALNVEFLTVHAAGGHEMLEAAAARVRGSDTKLLAVTLLTSLSPEVVRDELGVRREIADHVGSLADLARAAGCHGAIASPLEVARLRAHLGPDFLLVVPGIRPRGGAENDQTRVAPPGEAIRAGADYLVVGRPITGAPDPRAAAEAIVAEMEEAHARK